VTEHLIAPSFAVGVLEAEAAQLRETTGDNRIAVALERLNARMDQFEVRKSDAELGRDMKRGATSVRFILAAVAAIVVATVAVLGFLEMRVGGIVRAANASQLTRLDVSKMIDTGTRGFAQQAMVYRHDADIGYLRQALPRIEAKQDEILERLPRRSP
jgi:hypothetical protein